MIGEPKGRRLDLSWAAISSPKPKEVLYGRGARSRVAELLAGKTVLLVASASGRKRYENDLVLGDSLTKHIWIDSGDQYPDARYVRSVAEGLAGVDFDAILGFGGGSALDFAKILSIEIENPNLARLAQRPFSELVLLPTTAGSGAEVTPFAASWDLGQRKKSSIGFPLISRVRAIVDPALTDDLPTEVTVSSGLDAVNQAFESLWNNGRTNKSIRIATESLSISLRALPRIVRNPSDTDARDQMAFASLLAGLCIAKTKTAICHSISYPLTAHFSVPHGFACSFTMVQVVSMVGHKRPDVLEPLLRKLNYDSAEKLVQEVQSLVDECQVKDEVSRRVQSPGKLLALSSEMISVERSDNFVIRCGIEDIESIVKQSF